MSRVLIAPRSRPLRLALLAAATLLGIPPRSARAGGFEIYDHAPAATAMAGAVVAKADDPAAVFYNPAGIALHPGGGALLGATLQVTPWWSRTPGAAPITTASAGANLTAQPDLYVTAHALPRIALGIGAFSQFGSALAWRDQGERLDLATFETAAARFPGRLLGTTTRLQTLTLNPTLALRPSDAIAIGAGIDVLFGALDVQRAVQYLDVEGAARVGGTARGVGWNFGVLIDLVPDYLAAGLAYRSAIGLDFDLRARFDAPPELAPRLADQPARGQLALPHNFTLGLAARPLHGLTVTTDLHATLWSDARQLEVTFPIGNLPPLAIEQGWRDTLSARLGGEYLLFRRQGTFALRGGVGFDMTPVPAATLGPALPDSDRVLASAGLGWSGRGFAVDVAYAGALLRDRVSLAAALPSLYGGQHHVVSAAVTYQWGRPVGCRHCGRCGGRGSCCDPK